MLTKTGKAQLNELQYAEEVVLVYSSPDGQKLHVVQGPSLANTLRGHGNPIANAPPPLGHAHTLVWLQDWDLAQSSRVDSSSQVLTRRSGDDPLEGPPRSQCAHMFTRSLISPLVLPIAQWYSTGFIE